MSTFLDHLKNAVIGLAVVGLATGLIGYLGLPLLGDLGSLTPEQLSAIAGIVLTFALDKLPFLSSWFNALDPLNKGWATGGSLVGLGAGLFGLSCAGRLGESVAIACTTAGAVGLLSLILAALVTSQGAYLMFVKTKPKGWMARP